MCVCDSTVFFFVAVHGSMSADAEIVEVFFAGVAMAVF